jgi:cell division protein FtsN
MSNFKPKLKPELIRDFCVTRRPLSSRNLPQSQAGGTILGMIIGLIVGLSIAVGVAIMITKTSLPFTNKQAQPERVPAPTAATNTSNTPTLPTYDPNKPLYGNKEPAREAAKRLTTSDNPVNADGRPPIVDRSTPEKSKTGDRISQTGEGVQDRITGAKSDVVDEKFTYFLQAGAFREPGDAESAKAKLALLGFEANVTERPSDTGSLYRVRIGPFSQLETMTRARGKLSDNGVDVAVIRTAR